MTFDLTSAGLGAILGTVLWEAGKQAIGAGVKRFGDKQAAKRKLLSEHGTTAKAKISVCLQHAVEYLTSECSDARKIELGRHLRHEASLLGQAVKDMNTCAESLKLEEIEPAHLIRFRKAVTWNIDSKSYKPQLHDSFDVRSTYQTGFALQEAVTRLQLAGT